jgi:hypothetical protein
MSADACVVYYGLRFEVAPDEIEALERRTDQRMVAARSAGLKTFWANFGAPDKRYLLFVGAELGLLGLEGEAAVQVDDRELQAIIESTVAKLQSAGLPGEPKLHMQWYADV